MSAAEVLLLTQEDRTVTALRAALEPRAPDQDIRVCGTMMDLRSQLARREAKERPALAFVDIDPNPQQTLSELGRITVAYPHTWFVVVSREFDERRVLHAMQAGARHFLRKDAGADGWDEVLEHLLVQEPSASLRLGVILAVFSCSGGCGATTVAINLANELRLLESARVLLVDLDPHYGAAASYLGAKGRYGVAHILGREGAIDRHVIESTAVRGAELDVLLSPAVAEADVGRLLDYRRLPATLEACREAYDYILVDAPRLPREVVTDLASLSRMNLPVLQLTVRDVAFAGALVSFLADRGIARERILPVANRFRRRGPLLGLEETRQAIGMPSLFALRNDWSKAVRSLHQSRPLAGVAKRSRLRRDFCRLAALIHQQTRNET